MENLDLPLIISDSKDLRKIESVSDGSVTLTVSRGDDSLWEWKTSGIYFYGKKPDTESKPHICAFNELAGRYFSDFLGINNQKISILNTCEGIQIGSLIDLEYPYDLNRVNISTLKLTTEEKIKHTIFYILLADTDGNLGSVLVHKDKSKISRIDFERCFGYNGQNYSLDVLNGLGNINPGPFVEELKKINVEHYMYFIDDLCKKIKTIDIEKFKTWSDGVISGLSLLWPKCSEDLKEAVKHICCCIAYRKENIKNLFEETYYKKITMF
jgi:hypothetical protein